MSVLDPIRIKKQKAGLDFEPVLLGAGQSFGELALIYDIRRAASIQTHTDCHFAVLG